MDTSFPEAEDIDSLCERRLPDPEEIESALPRCKGETVTYFATERGSRLYVCEDHAREVLRFGEDPDGVVDMDEDDLRDYATEQGVNPSDYGVDELRRHLLSPVDPADLDDHPRVSPCRGCHKLTLYDDLDAVDKRCPACREGYPEIETAEV